MEERTSLKKTAKKAFKDSIPVLTGYIVLGIGFGVLLQSKGYNVLWSVAMAITIFSGTLQYLGVELLASGAPLITTAVMTLLINARYFFYGLAMLDKYRKAPKKYRPYLIFALTDETYALTCMDVIPGSGVDQNKYYLFVSLFDHCYWITGCVLGSVLGSLISFDSTGIDFVMTALFVVIFIDQWYSTKQHLPAIIGVAVTLLCLIIFGADVFVIPSMIGITVALMLSRKKLEGEKDG